MLSSLLQLIVNVLFLFQSTFLVSLCDYLLLEFSHFFVKLLLSLEDVSKSLLIPSFDLAFQEFEFLLKLKCFLAFWHREVVPSGFDEVFESRMCEPKSFEMEWTPDRVSWSLPLERDRPMIKA